MLIEISYKAGAKALAGDPEYIEGIIFNGVDYDRKLTARGTLIQVYDPAKDMSTPPYWEYEDQHKDETTDVTAGYKVRVTASWVKFH